jgi:hypothetical protein
VAVVAGREYPPADLDRRSAICRNKINLVEVQT